MSKRSTTRKRKPGLHEKLRLGGGGAQAVGQGGRFERAQRRGADGDDAASRAARPVDRGDRRLGHREALAVHVVLRQIFNLDRLERTCADVQRHIGRFDAALAQPLEQGLIEMQAGRGRGHRTRVARVHGLIARAIVRLRFAGDIRRQRDLAVAIEIGLERHPGVETQSGKAAVALEHGGAEAVLEQYDAASPGRVAGGHLHPRFVGRDDAFEQQLDRAATRLAPAKSGAHHLGVVEDQQIARHE